MAPYTREFYDVHDKPGYRAAEKMLGYLFDAYRPASMVDIGCGSGAWLRAAHDLGVPDLSGIDGPWVDAAYFEGTPLRFTPLSLEEPLRLGRRYDLAVSLEVVEHLSPARGEGFVRDLCAASDAVLFSGAVPDQGGVHHVNERWPSYWAAVFDRAGYACRDIFRGRFWTDGDIPWFYRQNTLLFVARGSPAEGLLDGARLDAAPPLDLVHPEAFATRSALLRPEAMSGLLAVRALPHVLRRRLAGLVRRRRP